MAHAVRAASWVKPAGSTESLLIFRFVDLLVATPVIRVLGSYSERSLRDWLNRFPDEDSFEVHKIGFAEPPFYAALQERFVWLGGVPSNSLKNGSQAIYWAECDLGDHAHKIYSLLPNSQTSPHRHRGLKERFFRMAGGDPLIRLGKPTFTDGETRHQLRVGRAVRAGVSHQLMTRTAPVLILVEMEGPNPLGMRDHHYDV